MKKQFDATTQKPASEFDILRNICNNIIDLANSGKFYSAKKMRRAIDSEFAKHSFSCQASLAQRTKNSFIACAKKRDWIIYIADAMLGSYDKLEAADKNAAEIQYIIDSRLPA